jgi:carbon monoxide dehydrogenase subunit G
MFKNRGYAAIALTLFAAMIWSMLPASFSASVGAQKRVLESGGGDPLVILQAQLGSSTSAANGKAKYRVFSDGNRKLEVEVEDVPLAAGTVLTVFVDGAVFGNITLSSLHAGEIEHETEDGQAVPQVTASSTVVVKNGADIVAQGSFDGAPPPPPPAGSGQFAALTGPAIGGITPHGSAEFSNAGGERELEVEAEDVNLAVGTVLSVEINGAAVGQMTLNAVLKAEIRLNSDEGDTVPVIAAGDTVTVKNGAATILSGVFGSTPPPPTAPATAFSANMTGPAINGVAPIGVASFLARNGNNRLKFNIRVNLPTGTVVGAFINSTQVGTITLRPEGEGELELESENGQTVPVIAAGDTASIRNGDTTVLSGTFQTVVAPPPSVQQVRSFEGNLSGAQVVPAVTTSGRGEVKIKLNSAETQIEVKVEFKNLSNAQTSASINGPATSTTNGPVIFNLGVAGGTQGKIERTFNVTSEQIQQLRTGSWYVTVGSTTHPDGELRAQFRSHGHHADVDGDGVEDLSLFRPSNGGWYSVSSSTNQIGVQIFGGAVDTPVSGDFDGDGKTDIAVYHPDAASGLGVWYINRSFDGGFTIQQFGLANDIPLRGDFDGDGRNDIAVFRPSNGVWFIQKSAGGFTGGQFGISGDKPVASDFDGDGKTDIALYRQSNGTWYWVRSSDNQIGIANFGLNGDIPLAADRDGDGISDIAVFRPSNGGWYWINSSNGQVGGVVFGQNGDVPVSGDFDGDQKTDVAIFRPANGAWYIYRSLDGQVDIKSFGLNGDIPALAQ